MTSGQHIDYDALALEALRGVVKACLAQVARTGLLGDHHFYIAFNTQAPGVVLSKRLREKYPQEMTIVLQHRFWELSVEDDRFEVRLTFDGIPERLVIPFKSIKVFYDPSVPYGLQFEEVEASAAPDAARRSTRRTVGVAKDSDPRSRSMTDVPGFAGQASDEPEGADEAGERRRPRRGRPERQLEPAAAEPRPAAGNDRRGADPDPEQEPVPAPPEAAQPAPQKPAALAAVVQSDSDDADTGPEGPDDGDAPAGGGAKIFDLAKFRNRK